MTWDFRTPLEWLVIVVIGLFLIYLAARLVFSAYFKTRNEYHKDKKDGV